MTSKEIHTKYLTDDLQLIDFDEKIDYDFTSYWSCQTSDLKLFYKKPGWYGSIQLELKSNYQPGCYGNEDVYSHPGILYVNAGGYLTNDEKKYIEVECIFLNKLLRTVRTFKEIIEVCNLYIDYKFGDGSRNLKLEEFGKFLEEEHKLERKQLEAENKLKRIENDF